MSSTDSDQNRLVSSMQEKRPKDDTIIDFMEEVENKEADLQTNLLSQID